MIDSMRAVMHAAGAAFSAGTQHLNGTAAESIGG